MQVKFYQRLQWKRCVNAFICSNEMFEVEGKVALITGALGGIGRCCVKALLQNGVMGVLLVDCNDGQSFVEELTSDFGVDKAFFVKADVSKEDELKSAFDEAIKRFGKLDIVINNAAVCVLLKGVVDVNLKAAVSSTFLATKYLSKGIILNMSSVTGLLPFSLAPTYSATKSGLICFGRCFKQDKATLVTLCPGFTETAMISTLHQVPKEHVVAVSGGFFEMIQSAEDVAKAMVEVIKVGGNGSVWVVNNGEPPFEVDFEEVDLCIKKQILHK